MESKFCMSDSKISILAKKILSRNHKYLKYFLRIHWDMQPDIYAQRYTTKELHRWDNLNLFLQNKYYKCCCIDSKLNLINNNCLDKKQHMFCWGVKEELHRWYSLNLSPQNKYCMCYCIYCKLSLINNIHLDKKQSIFCSRVYN